MLTYKAETEALHPGKVDFVYLESASRNLSTWSISHEYTKLTGESVSPSGIRKHYTKLGVTRDLISRINARAHELVRELVHTETAISEDEIVDVNSQQLKILILTEQRNVACARRILTQLLDHLEDQIINCKLYDNLGEMMRSPDEGGHNKLNDLYRKVISFPGHVNNMKKLSNALKTLIDLERRIYKLDETASEEGIEDFLRKVKPPSDSL